MISLRTRVHYLRPLISRSSDALTTPVKNGHRQFQTSASLDRIIRPRFPDFSPKISPELKVPDTVVGEGEPHSLKDDPDAPTFEMDDPYVETPPKCVICENQITYDYKNVQLLSQFISTFTGTIYPRKVVGLCTVQYDQVVKEIIYARRLAMMTHKYKSQSYYDDTPLMYPRPDKVIRKRLADAAAEYKRQNYVESGEDNADEQSQDNDDQISVSNQ